MAKHMKLEFDGFENVIARISKLGGDIKGTTEEALQKSRRYVHKNLGSAMQKHNNTYGTIRSLNCVPINADWEGTVATIEVGFKISEGGLPSIFLMYGTPRIDKDQKLYNAAFGAKTQKDVRKIQEDIFYNEIRRING